MYLLTGDQFICTKRLHYRIHPLPARHCVSAFSLPSPNYPEDTCLPVPCCLVISGRSQYSWWKWGGQKQSWACRLPTLRVLSGVGMLMLYQLDIL
jgi:hypothetical protein